MRTYTHPQGATIVVYDDGSLVKYGKNGKPTKTSATAAKLATGHGGWVLVQGEAVDFTQFNSDREAVPGGVVRIPMKFKSAPIDDLDKYITDDDYVIQQKIDGIRAQIVFNSGERGCWVRSNSGERLKSSTSAPVVVKIENAFKDENNLVGCSIDGEIINGVFWAFDIIIDTAVEYPLKTRSGILSDWIYNRPSDFILELPTATTTRQKQALVDKVIANNGEGFIVKHKDYRYTWGGRVDHSLKIKLVETVDCIVTSVGNKGKDSVDLGVYDGNNISLIGKSSTIGKGDFECGDVIEVQYLYAGAGGKLVQPTILKKRLDKKAEDCTIDQLKYVNKEVVV